jgi:hypothetical protein
MKRLKKAGFILLAVFCIAMFYGCKEEEAYPWKLGTFEGLDAETEWRIIQAYFDTYVKPKDPDAKINDTRIARYFGTYNGVVVVQFAISFPNTGEESEDVIHGLQFTYHPSVPIVAWGSGILYRLREAYDLGLLTEDDVKSIHRMYYAQLTDGDYADFIGGNNHD